VREFTGGAHEVKIEPRRCLSSALRSALNENDLCAGLRETQTVGQGYVKSNDRKRCFGAWFRMAISALGCEIRSWFRADNSSRIKAKLRQWWRGKPGMGRK